MRPKTIEVEDLFACKQVEVTDEEASRVLNADALVFSQCTPVAREDPDDKSVWALCWYRIRPPQGATTMAPSPTPTPRWQDLDATTQAFATDLIELGDKLSVLMASVSTDEVKPYTVSLFIKGQHVCFEMKEKIIRWQYELADEAFGSWYGEGQYRSADIERDGWALHTYQQRGKA